MKQPKSDTPFRISSF